MRYSKIVSLLILSAMLLICASALSGCARNLSPYARHALDLNVISQSELPSAPYAAGDLACLGWQKWLHPGQSDEAEKLWLKAL